MELIPQVERAIERTLEALGPPTGAEVSLSLVSDAEIRGLNRIWRGIDRVTDVLSFAQREGEGLVGPDSDGPEALGDVIIAIPRARRQAREYGHGLVREVAFLAVHGTLHLLGLDHQESAGEEEMNNWTERILSELGLQRSPDPSPSR